MEIILYKPEIAGNVGAIIRLAANTGIPLHIVESKTLEFEETKIKRAGLDYHDIASVTIHDDWKEYEEKYLSENFLVSTSKSDNIYWEKDLTTIEYIIFGPESVGLPDDILNRFEDKQITIPMDDSSRSINLANAVGIVMYEYLRQNSINK